MSNKGRTRVEKSQESARLARVTHFSTQKRMIDFKAKEQARANRSDPFVLGRVRSMFLNGAVLEPSDFKVEWSKEERTTELGDHSVRFDVDVPRSVKIV